MAIPARGRRAVTGASRTNWAGNHTYRARRLHRPGSIEELQELVSRSARVRALGSRHSFTDLADTDGVLVSLDRMDTALVIDEEARVAHVPGGATYGEVAAGLHARGWALANLASLPHISVAGAVATGTHGSGDALRCLSASVGRMEVVGPDGEVTSTGRTDQDFDGWVVALGALGVVTTLDLDVEPAYDVAQTVYVDVPWDDVYGELDRVRSRSYSVSVFTDWRGRTVPQVWVKSRTSAAAPVGWRAADRAMHMLPGAQVEAVTEQLGLRGPWHERLPHFRADRTPSRGAELQSEYFVARDRASEAFDALRGLGARLAGVLQVAEIRTVAADGLWLSGAFERDCVGLHFTWLLDTARVHEALRPVEDALLPLGARPHWGKVFLAGADALAAAYPRFEDFRRLRARRDPEGTFANAFLARVLGEDLAG